MPEILKTARQVSARRGGQIALTCLAAFILYAVLIAPNHPAALSVWSLFVFPLEWPVIVLALVILPATGGAAFLSRILLVLVLTVLTLLKLADFSTFLAYNRGFNPVVDGHLVIAAWHLASGVMGVVMAAMAVVVLIGAIGALAFAIWWATGMLARTSLPLQFRPWMSAVTVALAVFAIAEVGHSMRHWQLPFDPPGAAFTARVGAERIVMVRETVAGLRAFRAAAATDLFADASPLLDQIGDRDVLFIYIESYGSSSLANPRYRPTHLETLQAIETELSAKGLALRSGWLEAPMIGGQSWLSHATVSQGLWIPNQKTYGAALVSGRKSLFHLAQDAGFSTTAVMPAITMDWPEANFMGFDRILPASELGYQGLAFNWVTMPDQFTLTALERLVLQGTAPTDRAPVFAQVALISSHAPWTPVPTLLDWDAINDGSGFNGMAVSGDPPDVVWRDQDRVRDQFRQAIDYSLRTVGEFAARHARSAPLIVILGDHQPARFVSESDSFTVPVHVVGPPELVDRFAAWGWSDGLVPDDRARTWRMDAFRNQFLTTFSSGTPNP